MKIDLVMISRLGQSDGGRETWLKNFLCEIERRNVKCVFDLFSLAKGPGNILSLLKRRSSVIDKEVEFKEKLGGLPISLVFLLKFFITNFWRKKNSDHVIAVGGLEEALSVVMSYCLRPVRGKRVLWLRTIYTKEKGYLLNGVTQKILLKIELYVIKNFFDIIIANGEDTADFYRGKGVDCVVIPNAIDLKKWVLIKKVESKKTRIAFIGRLTTVKGLEAFVDSVALIKNRKIGEEFEFHVMGDGPLRSVVEEAQEKNLLIYHGNIPNDDLPKMLESVDCCVALTLLKDFMGGGGVSNALLEQMASGQIIVAWDNNIFRNVLTDETAYLVEQNNAIQLASAYEFLHQFQEDAVNKSIAAKTLSNFYSIEAHVEKFFELID